jgi:hypothetical protein
MFGTDMRGLADAGLACRPHKIVVGGETGVWDADFKGSMTREKFLASTPAQYTAFERSMTKLAPYASKHVGTKVNGVACTLSGLLGVGHHAGITGIAGWVADPAVRKKFQKTTSTFLLTNGVF